MFFGETGHDDGDEEEQDEDKDEDEDEDEDDDDDDDADDDEEDETIEWWILGLCPEMQNAHPIDTVTVNIYWLSNLDHASPESSEMTNIIVLVIWVRSLTCGTPKFWDLMHWLLHAE